MGSFLWCCLFFFQAEDGIRDSSVTGVQTCALPISGLVLPYPARHPRTIVIAQYPVRPCSRRQYLLVLKDDFLDCSRVPWRRQQREVERQMRAREIPAVIGNETFERKIDFPDQYTAIEFIDHAPHLRDHVMDFRLIGGMQREDLLVGRPALANIRIRRTVAT